MNRTRRKHTEEFKREAVTLVAEHGYSYAEAGRSLGVNAGLIAKWRQIFESGGPTGGERMTADQRRIKDLEVENRRLKMEREILKKATAFFAKENP